jgi:hypothetical protein
VIVFRFVWFRQILLEGQGQLGATVIGHTDMVWTLHTPESKGRAWEDVSGERGEVDISVHVFWKGGGGGAVSNTWCEKLLLPLLCIVGE